jgi:pimeloyl-ACP methyl ester carboxylesterase
VGIPSSSFNLAYSEQANSQWCWAACIQMILNYYGIDISQYDIVQRTYGQDPYGNLPNWSGSYEVITDNLNNWGIDRSGAQYTVSTEMGYGQPDPAAFVDELGNQRPVLIGYSTGAQTGHAVVATAASFYGSAAAPVLASFVVRDPRENTLATPYRGRREYDASSLGAVSVYWYIRVEQGGR